jgi:hypothetical protein
VVAQFFCDNATDPRLAAARYFLGGERFGGLLVVFALSTVCA